MVADVLEGAGFEMLELGADVPTGALRAFVAEHMPAVIGLTSSLTRDAPELAAAIIAVHDADPECRIMLGGNGVPLPWRKQSYPWVPDTVTVVETIERLLHSPPRRLPPAIARLRSGGTRAQPPPPASASAGEAESLELASADTSEVARHYARRAAEYRYLAYRDPLTALPNRRAFEDQVIALSRPGQDSALLAIDVDEFKEVNDTQGHEAGDALLHELGRAIHGAVRSTDTVARVGGDEFTVLLPACPPAEARRVAEQIRVAVEQMSGGKVTVSIGGARLGADRRGAALNADRALYAAKAAGRNRAELSTVGF
jgi:diguanylate cyclase (GGDEF)-like protein